jgi:autotransporter-associated beta strand protein
VIQDKGSAKPSKLRRLPLFYLKLELVEQGVAMKMKSSVTSGVLSTKRVHLLLAIAVFAITFPAQSATFTFSGTTSGTYNWSAGTNWAASAPVSAADTTLTYSGTLAASAAIVSNNDIVGNFQLNRMTFGNAGTTTAGTVTLEGGQLEFVNNGGTAPTLSVNLGSLGPTITINNNFLLTNSLNVTANNAFTIGGVISGGGDLIKTNTSTTNLSLTGANTYTGATILGVLGSSTTSNTTTLGGTNGAITASSGIGIHGSGSRLILDNATTANSNRIANGIGVTLGTGGDLNLVGNGATSSVTENIGNLTLGTGNNVVTVSGAGAGQLVTLNASGITRSGSSTALIRGTSLGQQATNAGRVTLDSTSGLTFVGATTTSTGLSTGTAKDVRIIPYLLGETSATGTGVATTAGFLTYDTLSGLRVLGTSEYTVLAAGFDSSVSVGHNVRSFNGTLSNANQTVNSLLVLGTNALNGSGTLTVNSGAVATNNTTANTAAAIGSGFSSLILGNGEGIMNVNGYLNVNTPINVTSSGGLVKGGTGTLVLNAANLYTGGTVVNSGTVQVAGGNLGSGTVTVNPQGTVTLNMSDGSTIGNAVVLNGNANITRAAATSNVNGITGGISGTGGVTLNVTGSTLALSGTQSTNTGSTTLTNGTLRVTGNVLSASSNLRFTPNNADPLISNPVLQLRADSDTTFQTGNVNVVGTTTAGARAMTINVDQATSGNTDKLLTLGGTFTVDTFQSLAQKVTVNVTGGSGYGLGIGNVSIRPNSSAGGWVDYNVTAAGGLRMGSVTIPSGGAVTLGFTGSEDTVITGDLVRGTQNMIVDQNGSGALTLEGSASSTGTGSYAFNLNAGTLNVNNANALRTGGTSTLNIAGGTLDNTSAGDITTVNPAVNINGNFAFGGTRALNLGTGATTLGTAAGTTRTITTNGTGALTLGGNIANGTTANALTKEGTGTLALTGANAYTGATVINNGTLLIGGSGSINTSSGVTVNTGANFKYNSSTAYTAPLTVAGGTVSGSGSLNVDLALNNIADTLSPGNSPGIMPFGTSQTWSALTYEWEVNDWSGGVAGTDFDQITIAGSLTLNNSNLYVFDVLSLLPGNTSGDVFNFAETDQSWVVLTTSGGITGFNGANWSLDASGFTNSEAGSFTLSQVGNNLVLDYTSAIPEPSTYAMLIGGLGMLALLRRRSKS